MSVKSKIVANLFGPFYSRTKSKSVEYLIDNKSPTLKDLVNRIIQEFPILKEFIFDKGNLAENTMIVLNGDIIHREGWEDIKITPEDRISFFQGQHGG